MKLMKVQEEALKRSAGMRGFGFFMEMGLGKTLTDQVELQRSVFDMNLIDRSLVICPNSFKGGWVRDAEKWDMPVDQCIWDSGSPHMDAWMRRKVNKPRQLLINYEAIRSASTMAWLKNYFDGMRVKTTFDESIQLKQHDSQQTMAGIEIGKMSDMIRCLSGKPTTQGPHDLWGQLRAMREIDGSVYYAFKNRYTKKGGFKGKQVVGTRNERGLQMLLEPIAFYATKADWSDIPPKLFTQREYRMTPKMQAQFDEMYNDFVLFLSDAGDDYVAVDAAITKYIKLAQIQAGFIIKEDHSVVELVEPKDNPRVKLLREIIDQTTGKVLIPYHHKYVREILVKAFKDLNPAVLRGGMNPAEIDAEKDQFNDDPACRVMFLQTKASKYGHTLLGGPEPENHCSTMVFFENTYSLDDRSQIEDRNNRWGQLGDHCLYIDLCGTILDLRMTAALAGKEDMFQSIFSALRSAPR